MLLSQDEITATLLPMSAINNLKMENVTKSWWNESPEQSKTSSSLLEASRWLHVVSFEVDFHASFFWYFLWKLLNKKQTSIIVSSEIADWKTKFHSNLFRFCFSETIQQESKFKFNFFGYLFRNDRLKGR